MLVSLMKSRSPQAQGRARCLRDCQSSTVLCRCLIHLEAQTHQGVLGPGAKADRRASSINQVLGQQTHLAPEGLSSRDVVGAEQSSSRTSPTVKASVEESHAPWLNSCGVLPFLGYSHASWLRTQRTRQAARRGENHCSHTPTGQFVRVSRCDCADFFADLGENF